MPASASPTVATEIVNYLKSQHVERAYGLSGGHIQPLWDAIARAGIAVVDVRHEASAVYMAHAESQLTGHVGVAVVTAGPGVTNAVTAIANASVTSTAVLVLAGRTPRPQAGMGAMQDIPQAEVVAPLCRRIEQTTDRHHVLQRLDATAAAALGHDGAPGPAYIDVPADLFEETTPAREIAPRQLHRTPPKATAVADAHALIARSQRPLVITGNIPDDALDPLAQFLDSTNAAYLDTGESRALLPAHPSYVPAMRSRVMREADLVITLARRLDFQLAYGSPAAFSPTTRMLRIGRTFAETGENRPGDVEIQADVTSTLAELSHVAPNHPDQAWLDSLRTANANRTAKLSKTLANPPASTDDRMHPYQLIAAVNAHLDERAVVVADGGDILSFARVALAPSTYLDCGAFGCLGVGVPFATAAALTHPDRTVLALIGDGSLGFTAMDIHTAVRHHAPAVFVIANNEAWNIERHDQAHRYADHLVGVDLPGCRYDLLARGLGAYAERVEAPTELDAALSRRQNNAPAVLDVLLTQDALSPDFQSGLASVPSHQALTTWNDAELARAQPPPTPHAGANPASAAE